MIVPVRRCHECGTGKVVWIAKAGRKERYHSLVLVIPAYVKIPTCNKCGAEWMDPATALAIDDALKRVYSAKLTRSKASRRKLRPAKKR